MREFAGFFSGPGYGAYGSNFGSCDACGTECCGPDSPFRCLKCHFDYEEKNAFQFLPKRLRQRLKCEHDKILGLMQRGVLPLELIRTHSQLEEAMFPDFLPQEMNASLDIDHKTYSKVLFCG